MADTSNAFVFRKRMTHLYQTIIRTYLCGEIDQYAYKLAIQILSLMVEQRTDQVSFTIADTWARIIVKGNTVIGRGGPTFDMFEMGIHGALQQCQKSFGLVTARSTMELRRTLTDVVTGDDFPAHFSSLSGDEHTGEYNHVDKDMVLHCKYVEEQSVGWEEAITDFISRPGFAVKALPKWLKGLEV